MQQDEEDILTASRISVGMCGKDCDCQAVHLFLMDGDGELISTASMDPDLARKIAAEITAYADMVEARARRQAGRLS